jgi:phosphinothricin acetyltransferase
VIEIRKAELADLESITGIYNEAVQTTTATFDTEPRTAEEQARWFASHDSRHPVIVAVADDNVVGWACLSRWSERAAYDETAETSFYVGQGFRGQGVGRKLKLSIIEEARRLGYHSLIARVAEGNGASIHLNETAGFFHVGTLREVGRKFGRRLDVQIMQILLE